MEIENKTIILFTNLIDSANRLSYVFEKPLDEIICRSPGDIPNAYAKLEASLSKGLYVAGYLPYELGYFLDEVGVYRRDHKHPLLWFGIYKKPRIYDSLTPAELVKLSGMIESRTSPYWVRNINPVEGMAGYADKVRRIKEYIRNGDTYQVNYTFKLKFDFFGETLSLFHDLNRRQKVSYAAFVKNSPYSILSLSPEMFFRRDGSFVTARPMKGTAKRSSGPEEDKRVSNELLASIKNRAENLMIVDLFRNDLGRFCDKGSVDVVSLFDIERYETVHQMTSTINGRIKKGCGWHEIFKSIFPSGSVTGAPKIRTMQIISELEESPRGIYTGAIGFISPHDEAVFNIPIRTLVINEEAHTGEMGIGSGIVIDSDTDDEYEECLLKAKFFTGLEKQYELIETILWTSRKGFYLLRYHLERLGWSAEYFGFKYDIGSIRKALDSVSVSLREHAACRVRLLLNADGQTDISYEPVQQGDSATAPQRAGFSDVTIGPDNIFLFHKTTNRALYDKEYKKARAAGLFDIIFRNTSGYVTEGCISNIVIEKDGRWLTPPLSCGLLNGVYRRHLLETKSGMLKECPLMREDIMAADKVYMVNSVRGMVEVVIGE